MKRFPTKLSLTVGIFVAAATGGLVSTGACIATGANATGARLNRMKLSPNWQEGKFVNSLVIRQPPFFESLGRVVAEPDVEGSPLLYKRSLSWHFLALDVQFSDLRAAAKEAGGTINDAFLASLLGACRMYHAKLGYSIKEMPIAIPISVRRDEDDEGGNKFAGARFAAPVGVADPRARIKAIGDLVRSAREEPAIDGMALVAPALARLPGPLLGSLAGSLTKANDLQASNVPGFREELFIAGARIDRLYGFGPLPGCATMITLVTHGDTCCIAANVDRAAITDTELFGQCLEEGFAEVLALHEGAQPPRRRINASSTSPGE